MSTARVLDRLAEAVAQIKLLAGCDRGQEGVGDLLVAGYVEARDRVFQPGEVERFQRLAEANNFVGR